jgi:hypothetical protein
VALTNSNPNVHSSIIHGSLRYALDGAGLVQGFIIHTNGPVAGGWRVIEVWESQADFEAWFETAVKLAFPEGGLMPSMAFDELNEVVTA